MSSLSHQASRTIAVAVTAIINATAEYRIQRQRAWVVADARKNAYGIPSGTSQRHGNCRNCSFGRWCQNQRLTGNIIVADAAASATIVPKSAGYSQRPGPRKTARRPDTN